MKFFAIIDLCRAFFSIPVDKASQYHFALLGKENNMYTQTVLLQGFSEFLLFLANLKS